MDKIQENIDRHSKIHQRYGTTHTEIYNPIEQDRLIEALGRAKSLIKTSSKTKQALDYGCGDGNLTRQLLDLNFAVTAADVTPNFLEMIGDQFGQQCQTLLLNGEDLDGVADQSFDFIATYSVLHHIPDYLKAIREFIRVLKPGGVLYLDHERSPDFWANTDQLQVLHRLVELKEVERQRVTAGNFMPKVKNKLDYYKDIERVRYDYDHKRKLKKDPRYQAEGDIHVFEDDHIEWSAIEKLLKTAGFSVIERADFLLFDSKLYTEQEYAVFSQICNDESCLIAVKDL